MVAEELELLRTYFGLEQRRFGAAIELSVRVPEGVQEIPHGSIDLATVGGECAEAQRRLDPCSAGGLPFRRGWITCRDESDPTTSYSTAFHRVRIGEYH